MSASSATSLAVVALIAVLGASFIGTTVLWGRGRQRRQVGLPPVGSYPGSREHVGEFNLGYWESLSNPRRAAMDAAALEAAARAEDNAREAARAAVERAAYIDSRFRP